MKHTSSLALLGGTKAVTRDPKDMFTWPIITREDERAALDVLRRGAMSNLEVTHEFENAYARWQGTEYALAHNNGTAALHAAFFACGVGRGDEIICPSITYWASCMPALSLGARVVFADIDPATLCVDPADIERRLTKRTRALVVVHYVGHPADMDAIMRIARKHRLKVIEDVSHAHGALYKGRKVGTFGDAAGHSLMTGKSLAIGEGGMLTTNDRSIYERAVAFGHYERFQDPKAFHAADLCKRVGLPLGGCKYRMHQISSAVGLVQLRHYDQRMVGIQKAMNCFWDLLEGVPGIRAHRPARGSGSTMGGWYNARGLYVPEELGGLSVARFVEALKAEGVPTVAGTNLPLHTHPLFKSSKSCHLPVSESIGTRAFRVPWFKHYRPATIREYAQAIRKVVECHRDLLPGDQGNPSTLGGWGLFMQR